MIETTAGNRTTDPELPHPSVVESEPATEKPRVQSLVEITEDEKTLVAEAALEHYLKMGHRKTHNTEKSPCPICTAFDSLYPASSEYVKCGDCGTPVEAIEGEVHLCTSCAHRRQMNGLSVDGEAVRAVNIVKGATPIETMARGLNAAEVYLNMVKEGAEAIPLATRALDELREARRVAAFYGS